MPLAKKVIRKIENVIHDEMFNVGAQEVELSFVAPSDLWIESGRIDKFGKELLRFYDRKEKLFVLGPTHEEMMVDYQDILFKKTPVVSVIKTIIVKGTGSPITIL